MPDDHKLSDGEREQLTGLFGVDADDADALMDAGGQIEPLRMWHPDDVAEMIRRSTATS